MIPSIIHQIWLGPEPIYPDVLPLMEKTKKLADHYRLWQEDIWEDIGMTRKFFANYWRVDIDNSVALGDVLRVLVIQKYGGFYMDADVELRQPVSLYQPSGFIITTGARGKNRPQPYMVMGSCFGAEKNHPVLAEVIGEMEKRRETDKHWLDRVGFRVMQDVVARTRLNDVTYLDGHQSDRFRRHRSLGSWRQKFGE
jgi:mannosyltransferase OCH1-like enzyme